jgi:hypothetical protein|nr:MAG TPA_asm: Reverse gyrase zinc finger [Caudoviricetes sp.]
MTPIYVPDAIWPDDYMDWVHRECPVCKAEIHSDIYVRRLTDEIVSCDRCIDDHIDDLLDEYEAGEIKKIDAYLDGDKYFEEAEQYIRPY